jgi:peptidyl-prolyl cis-trans isomerase SurA
MFMKVGRLILMLALAAGLGATARAELADGVEAIVNDSVITYQQVRDFAAPEINLLQQQYADQPEALQQKLNEVITNSLEILVDRLLVLHDFDAEGYKLPDSYVDELVQDSIRERFGDRATLMKTLQARGETFEEFRKDLRDQFIEEQMRLKNVSQQIVISPYKVETYYRTHTNDFAVGDEVKLRMIVLNKTSPDDSDVKTMANEIRDEIKQGASFAQMASVYSQGSQQSAGGEWGWVGRSVLRQELADVAFSLKPGQVSDVIDTPQACYLMKVEDKRSAHVKPLSEVRNSIEATLRAQEQSRLQRQWYDRLKAKTFIRYFY